MSSKQPVQIAGKQVVLSNLQKVFFPETGFLKAQVVDFYSRIAETILPHLKGRPLTLKRYPDGISGAHFYEKNAPSHAPEWVKTFGVTRSEGGSKIEYVLCNDLATLVWVTNLGDIEKHVLLAKVPNLNRPTSIVFDLDPGEGADILDCARVALELRKIFTGLNLESFAKVSGSKGIHIAVPLNSATSYEATQPFAKAIAELAVRQMPDQVVSEMAMSLRRGKVLIDWSQNSHFKTTVCVYAMRAGAGGPFISVPVSWEELSKASKRGDAKALLFEPHEAVKRIKRLGDLFEPVLTLSQRLPVGFSKALTKAVATRLASWPKKKEGPRDESLKEYAAKRDHTRTPEPAAKPISAASKGKASQRFVVQKHAASHLHFDFRLEMQGVLRSWAIPKGPPTQPRETRLAMHVEDHPLAYADFEGTIPAGNYGAGTVMVWDFGEYQDITGNPAAAYHAGKMHIVMAGKKLKGEWILLKDRRDEENNRWLLIKAGEPIKLPARTKDKSAITGRSMERIAKENDRQWNRSPPARGKVSGKRRQNQAAPAIFVAPMQCKPVTELPEAALWSFELKFDGYRCIATKSGERVNLYSRNEKKLNARFPHLLAALGMLRGDFVIDGEVVALKGGKPSFQLLQDGRSKPSSIFYYAFDLLNQDGEMLLNVPLEQRRARLEQFFENVKEPLRLSPLLTASERHILNAVRKLGLEGVIAKQKGSIYEPGERTGLWVKYRLNREQEFVIGGFIPGSHGFDSLLVGVHVGRDLHFVAQVRNGFAPRSRDAIVKQLRPNSAKKCPFQNIPDPTKSRWGTGMTAETMKECRWLKPKLVCHVAFVEWTDGARLRHPAFVAMRDDKSAAKVTRES